jgi:hypothetical protein
VCTCGCGMRICLLGGGGQRFAHSPYSLWNYDTPFPAAGRCTHPLPPHRHTRNKRLFKTLSFGAHHHHHRIVTHKRQNKKKSSQPVLLCRITTRRFLLLFVSAGSPPLSHLRDQLRVEVGVGPLGVEEGEEALHGLSRGWMGGLVGVDLVGGSNLVGSAIR